MIYTAQTTSNATIIATTTRMIDAMCYAGTHMDAAYTDVYALADDMDIPMDMLAHISRGYGRAIIRYADGTYAPLNRNGNVINMLVGA